MKIEGIDALQKKLSKLAEDAAALDGEHQVPATELLTPEFLSKNTGFSSFDDLLDKSGFKDEFESVSQAEKDQFISKNSSFAGWDDMIRVAGKIWVRKKLGL